MMANMSDGRIDAGDGEGGVGADMGHDEVVAGFSRHQLFRGGDTVLRQRREYLILRKEEQSGRLVCNPKHRRREDPRTVDLSMDQVRLRELGYRWPWYDYFQRRYSISGGPKRHRVHDRARDHEVVAEGLDFWTATRVRDLLEERAGGAGAGRSSGTGRGPVRRRAYPPPFRVGQRVRYVGGPSPGSGRAASWTPTGIPTSIPASSAR
jgi:hypothetical protein